MKAIETTDLTKYYGKARGIIKLNLSVEEGEFFGFLQGTRPSARRSRQELIWIVLR